MPLNTNARTIAVITYTTSMKNPVAINDSYALAKIVFLALLLHFSSLISLECSILCERKMFAYCQFLNLNTIFNLLFSYLLLCLIESDIKLTYKSVLIVIICAASFLTDYKIIGLLLTTYFYVFMNNKYKFHLLPILYMIIITLNIVVNNLDGNALVYSIMMNIGLFLTIPLFYL